MMLLIVGWQHSENVTKKKMKEGIKEKLINSQKESDDEYDLNVVEIGEGIKKLENAITIIKRYEEIIKI